MSSLSLVQSCLWTVTRCVPLVQQKLLTFIRAHEFTQPWSILSLNSDTYVPLVQQKLLTFIRAHEFTQPCSILSLNSDTMGAPSAAKTSYLYQSTWAQPCSILSLFTQPCSSDTMGAPRAAETSYLYHSTWVHSALFNLVFEQWHDVCP